MKLIRLTGQSGGVLLLLYRRGEEEQGGVGGEECHSDGSTKFKDGGETCHTSRGISASRCGSWHIWKSSLSADR